MNSGCSVGTRFPRALAESSALTTWRTRKLSRGLSTPFFLCFSALKSGALEEPGTFGFGETLVARGSFPARSNWSAVFKAGPCWVSAFAKGVRRVRVQKKESARKHGGRFGGSAFRLTARSASCARLCAFALKAASVWECLSLSLRSRSLFSVRFEGRAWTGVCARNGGGLFLASLSLASLGRGVAVYARLKTMPCDAALRSALPLRLRPPPPSPAPRESLPSLQLLHDHRFKGSARGRRQRR